MLVGAIGYVVAYPSEAGESIARVIFLFDGSDAGAAAAVWAIVLGWNALVLVLSILVIRDGVRHIRAGRTREPAAGVLLVKLASIPFFVVNFLVMGSAGAVTFVFANVLAPVQLAVVAVVTWFAMVSTSIYGWASIVALVRAGRLRIGLAVLYSLLLLIFVADIAAAVLIFGHSRRRPGLALVIVLVTFWVMVTVVATFVSIFTQVLFPWLGLVGLVPLIATVVIALVVRAQGLKQDRRVRL